MPNKVGQAPKSIYKDGTILTDTLGSENQYDQLVFVGRFQPLHYGHMRVMDIALRRSKKLIILAGSANAARTLRNPFTFEERYAMIASQYGEAIKDGRLVIKPLDDYTYRDEQWIEAVQDAVDKESIGPITGLIGCEKDHTSYYLSLFPQWENIGVEFKVPLNSTDVRKAVFLQHSVWNDRAVFSGDPTNIVNEFYEFLDDACPREISGMLHQFVYQDIAREIRQEWLWIEKYRKERQTSNYPVLDQTVDACVIQSGHVLVVRRGRRPGYGTLALPGGFLNEDEPVRTAMLRELREETCIDVSDTVLRAAFIRSERFDDPKRSDRGRIITECGLFKLQDRPSLPHVKGRDDAKEAFWLPLNKVEPKEFFEDHAFIIQKMSEL